MRLLPLPLRIQHFLPARAQPRSDVDTELYGLNLRMALSPQLQLSTFYQRNTANETSAFRETGEQIIAKFTYLFEA